MQKTPATFFLLATLVLFAAGIAIWLYGSLRVGPESDATLQTQMADSTEQQDPSAGLRSSAVLLPPADTPLVHVMQQLERAALAGSPQAACRIAIDAWRCSTIQVNENMAEILAGVQGLPVSAGGKSISEALLDQAETDTALCAGVARENASAYRFQQIAADRGGQAYQRWLLLAPALRQDYFLEDIDGWSDYKRRSEHFIVRSLKEKNPEDFQLLLAVYAPSYVRGHRPPFQVDDPDTFLALAEVAENHRLPLAPEVQAAAAQMKKSMSSSEQGEFARRTAAISEGWSFPDGSASLAELFNEQWSASFCQ